MTSLAQRSATKRMKLNLRKLLIRLTISRPSLRLRARVSWRWLSKICKFLRQRPQQRQGWALLGWAPRTLTKCLKRRWTSSWSPCFFRAGTRPHRRTRPSEWTITSRTPSRWQQLQIYTERRIRITRTASVKAHKRRRRRLRFWRTQGFKRLRKL